MGFTTPCFIRKNTKKIRKKLYELGYNRPTGVIEDERFCIATSSVNYNYHIIKEGSFDDTNLHHTWNCAGRIDCGTNEELFLAIAALRDDTDKYQWFTDGNKWIMCPAIKFSSYWVYNDIDVNIDTVHKATVDELIEHFKTKEE